MCSFLKEEKASCTAAKMGSKLTPIPQDIRMKPQQLSHAEAGQSA
jgi:hypothetical protein